MSHYLPPFFWRQIEHMSTSHLPSLHAVSTGTLISLSKVEDALFSYRVLGDGYCILAKGSQVVAPCDGTITMTFPTKHCFALQTKEQETIWITLGIDTIQLEGKPFTSHVHVGQTVKTGDLLCEMNLSLLDEYHLAPYVIVTIPDCMQLPFSIAEQEVQQFQPLT